ncbi:hypothetical protein AX17_002222 [Amanita inopinata Kibby_2008]|nr:hypothetical protein AX17_002222 [Amanita inopinata Kibby_2008]
MAGTSSSPSTSMSRHNPKRFKPPNISLSLATEKRGPNIQVLADSPTLGHSDTLQLSGDEFEDTLQLSSSSGSSGAPSPAVPKLSISLSEDDDDDDDDGKHDIPDDISKDLAALQQLRKSVKTNLRLRPIRSHNALPKVNLDVDGQPSSSKSSISPPRSAVLAPASSVWGDLDPPNKSSPSSAISTYFTPLCESRPSPRSAKSSSNDTGVLSPFDAEPVSRPIPPGILYSRLTFSINRPLLIDTRPPASHLTFHLRHSINIAIPTLILKRCRKPNGGFQSLEALRQFITTEQGKSSWDELMQPDGPWDGDVVVYDDEMDPKDKSNIGSTAWALMPVLAPLLRYGFVNYLEGGISAAHHHPDLETLITAATDISVDDGPVPPRTPPSGALKKGLFQLDTGTALRSKPLPEIEPSSASSSNASTPPPLRSPIPVMPTLPPPPSSLRLPPTSRSATTSPRLSHIDISDPSPSPPPSQVSFRRAVAPPRRPSVPNLRRLDTDRLSNNASGLSIRTKPTRSATLTVPPSLPLSLQVPASPSHLNLVYSNHSPPGSARRPSITSPPLSAVNGSFSLPINGARNAKEMLTPYYTPPHSPYTPRPTSSPMTARPDLDSARSAGDEETPPSSEEGYPTFTVSTILPNFLYLGPELTVLEHVEELRELGVRRILNIAAECDDDHGLKLKEVFEKYIKIPMRDTVEEENIAWGVRQVCNFLDDARLHSAPTYVHCKAGKSRSVTAVMAYLIHANHWTLARAYAFVLERRKGISPNIGFVSELMTFEEQELGGKSVGVQPSAPAGISTSSNKNKNAGDGRSGEEGGGGGGGFASQQGDTYVAAAHHLHHHLRRGGHARESLPPQLATSGMSDGPGATMSPVSMGPMSAGGFVALGDSWQELEVKDASGRYRHARRAPVDETTLQPMRRVSKAGLESSGGS